MTSARADSSLACFVTCVQWIPYVHSSATPADPKINLILLCCFRYLDKLRICYEDVFTDSCGLEGGSVIGGLMMRAFRDPFYLRYR